MPWKTSGTDPLGRRIYFRQYQPEFDRALNVEIPLTIRARYARSRNGDEQWWRDQFARIDSPDNAKLLLILAAFWMTPNLLQTLVNDIDVLVKELIYRHHHDSLVDLAFTASESHPMRSANTSFEFDSASITDRASIPFRVALWLHVHPVDYGPMSHRKFSMTGQALQFPPVRIREHFAGHLSIEAREGRSHSKR